MELTYVWLPLALAGGVVTLLAVVLVGRRRPRASDRGVVAAAHASRLRSLTAYRWALVRTSLALVLIIGSVGVTLTALAVIASRPVTAQVRDTDLDNRDIVLCLDVSGSMASVDARVLEYFGELAERFRGERIGLVLWDASPVVAFPLTDDYPYIARALDDLAESARLSLFNGGGDGEQPPLWAGTASGDASSLIGDGLASCVQAFDNVDKDRSRTIVLATDNELAGVPLLTLTEAMDVALDAEVRVYGLAPFPTPSVLEMDDETRRTGGEVFGIGDASAAGRIIDAVLSDQAATLDGVPELIVTDAPEAWLTAALVGIWGLAIGLWVVRW